MAATWHVTSQNQDRPLSETGPGFQNVWEVGYMIDSGPAAGTTGKVTIPAGQYNAANVKSTIDAIVYHHDQIGALGNKPGQ